MKDSSSPSLIDIDWYPSARKVRQFTACLVVLLLVVAWTTGNVVIARSCVGLSGLLLLMSCAVPASLRPLYVAVTLVTFPIGLVLGELALLTIFGLVFLPIGLCFRCLRRDALERKLERGAVSYWKEASGEPTKKSYLRRY